MSSNSSTRRFFLAYLPFVPVVTLALAFGVGHVDYRIYVPVWLIHSCFMVFGAWTLGGKFIMSDHDDKKRTAAIGLSFITPWVFAFMFGGMGPPPFTIAGWAELATEQQVRFGILIICGIFLSCGFSLLYEFLKASGENFYSRLGFTCIILAIPLFLITMAGWGTLITDTFKLIASSTSKISPDWLAPIQHLIEIIVIVWVALIYLASALFVLSLKRTNKLTSKACTGYLTASLLALAFSLSPPSSPEPIVIISYIVGIPAITFVIPYLIGINLLKKIAA